MDFGRGRKISFCGGEGREEREEKRQKVVSFRGVEELTTRFMAFHAALSLSLSRVRTFFFFEDREV